MPTRARRWTSPRWIAAVVVGLALWICARPALAIVDAGWVQDAHCCCPTPATCHCPIQHDGHGPQLRRCSNSGHLVTAVDLAVLAPPRLALVVPTVVRAAAISAPRLALVSRFVHPITPPS